MRAVLLMAVGGAGTASAVLPQTAAGQWSNRYPKVQGYSHHVYLEGYELPTMATGPTGAAPSPEGSRVAFSSRGWIWILDLERGVAERFTRGPEMDFRPSWSPDGSRLVFMRDNNHETWVVVADIRTGEEIAVVDSPAMELDPVFSADGTAVIYSSGEAGALDLWRYSLEDDSRSRITEAAGLEVRPQAFPNGVDLLYMAKGRGGRDIVTVRDASGGEGRELASAAIASLARPALSPDGHTVALNWPRQDGWDLMLLDVEQPDRSVLLVTGRRPLTPAWSGDGGWVYFSEAGDDELIRLFRVPAIGGGVEEVLVRIWDWGVQTGTIRVHTSTAGGGDAAPARLTAVDQSGHPALPTTGSAYFDGQYGRVFFYSPGVVEITVPAGPVTLSAVQGLATPEVTQTVTAQADAVVDVHLELEPVWDAEAAGWTSADHHFHLNYGGPYALDPEDLILRMRGEGLDVATPLLANLHNRFDYQDTWGWRAPPGAPLIRFGQEVRSHFLGHVALIETRDLHWPWVWGPGYQVYGRDDRTNGEVLEYAHDQGGLGYYVHPVTGPDPFADPSSSRTPVELVADAVLGDVDALELVCLWSNSVGTSEVWHRFLSLGIPVAPSAGTDVMTNFYRTMAVGVTRVYAQTDGRLNWPAYLEAYAAGKSFVTNGPMLDFKVGGVGPGAVVASGPVSWTLDVRSAVPVERLEVLVNGSVVWQGEGPTAPGRISHEGTLTLPDGGWVAVRASGGQPRWPAMDGLPFAHTGATWIDSVGSSDPDARRSAAQELLTLLDESERRLLAGYEGTPIPRLQRRFAEARAQLEEWIR